MKVPRAVLFEAYLLSRIVIPIPISIKITLWTGYDQWAQARTLCRVSMALIVFWYFSDISKKFLWITAPLLTLAAFAWLFICNVNIRSITRRERRAKANPNSPTPDSTAGAQLRLLSLICYSMVGWLTLVGDLTARLPHLWMAVFVVWGVSHFYAVPLAIADYFCVFPLPPIQRRKKEARDWFSFLRPVPVPT